MKTNRNSQHQASETGRTEARDVSHSQNDVSLHFPRPSPFLFPVALPPILRRTSFSSSKDTSASSSLASVSDASPSWSSASPLRRPLPVPRLEPRPSPASPFFPRRALARAIRRPDGRARGEARADKIEESGDKVGARRPRRRAQGRLEERAAGVEEDGAHSASGAKAGLRGRHIKRMRTRSKLGATRGTRRQRRKRDRTRSKPQLDPTRPRVYSSFFLSAPAPSTIRENTHLPISQYIGAPSRQKTPFNQ